MQLLIYHTPQMGTEYDAMAKRYEQHANGTKTVSYAPLAECAEPLA